MRKLLRITSTLGVAASLAGAAAAHAEDIESEVPDYRPFTISAEAGFSGLGGAVHWRIWDHIGIGAGFSGFGYSFDFDSDGVSYDTDLKLQAAPITLDIYPFKKRSFRISAGLAFNGNEMSSDSRFTEDQEIGNGIYTPAELGVLSLDVELGNDLVPYVSVGGVLFYFDKAHRWSLSGEIGVMFTGSPDVALSSSNSNPALDADLEIERQSIEDDLESLSFWPVAKIALSFSF